MKEEPWDTLQRMNAYLMREEQMRQDSGREVMTQARLHLEYLRAFSRIKLRYPGVPWDRPAALKEFLRTNPAVAKHIAATGALHAQSNRAEVRKAKARFGKRRQQSR